MHGQNHIKSHKYLIKSGPPRCEPGK